MHSSTSNSEHEFARAIPDLPWRGILITALALVTIATVGWEWHNRSAGYAPTLNDTPDLWAENRERVRPDSLVIIGASRGLFGLDLDVLEKGLGRRPVQLAIVGSTPYPVLADLAADESFHGTVICDLIPAMYFAPGGPLMDASQKALRRYHHWNHAQRWSHVLGTPLEESFTFLNQEDLTLPKLLDQLPITNRASAQVGPKLPPYFYSLDHDRRARMVAQAALVGSPLQQRVANGWLPLFTPPPPPSYVPVEQFGKMMGQAIEARYRDTVAHIARIRARGGRVVFVRMPSTGALHAQEEKMAPRAPTWDRLVRETGVPGIHFEDYPELNTFECPEWSHLSAPDSVEFTRRLIPYLRKSLDSF